MNGLLLDDEEIISAMDAENEKSSEFFKATYATLQNFDDLFDRVKKTVSSLYDEMKAGHFPINPKGIASSPCEYCDYTSVCTNQGACSLLTAEAKGITWDSFSEEENNETEVITDEMD